MTDTTAPGAVFPTITLIYGSDYDLVHNEAEMIDKLLNSTKSTIVVADGGFQFFGTLGPGPFQVTRQVTITSENPSAPAITRAAETLTVVR